MRGFLRSPFGLQLALAACLLLSPLAARGQTADAALNVTADVVNWCSIGNSDTALLSVTCATDTPMATDSVTADPAATATAASSSSSSSSSSASSSADSATGSVAAAFNGAQSDVTKLPQGKLCNSLAVTKLENNSFNQFIGDTDQQAAPPQRYFSTFQICF